MLLTTCNIEAGVIWILMRSTALCFVKHCHFRMLKTWPVSLLGTLCCETDRSSEGGRGQLVCVGFIQFI